MKAMAEINCCGRVKFWVELKAEDQCGSEDQGGAEAKLAVTAAV